MKHSCRNPVALCLSLQPSKNPLSLSCSFFMKPKSDSLPARVSVCFCSDVCEGDVRATLTQINYVPVLQRQCVNYLGHSVQEILELRERASESEKQRKAEKIYPLFTRCKLASTSYENTTWPDLHTGHFEVSYFYSDYMLQHSCQSQMFKNYRCCFV